MTIQLKYSSTPAAAPASLANGQIAINQADGKLFYRNASGVVTAFVLGSYLLLSGGTMANTNLVTNLNADLVDGKHVGTSGNTIPALNGANTWGAIQTFVAGTTVTDQLNITSTTFPQIIFAETEQALPLGRWRIFMDGGTLGFQRNTSNPAWTSGSLALSFATNDAATFISNVTATNFIVSAASGAIYRSINSDGLYLAGGGSSTAGAHLVLGGGTGGIANEARYRATVHYFQNQGATVQQLGLTDTAASFSGTVSGTQFQSTIATGTAPLTVTSTTKVTNLNADLLDGYNIGTSGGAIPLLNTGNNWSAIQHMLATAGRQFAVGHWIDASGGGGGIGLIGANLHIDHSTNAYHTPNAHASLGYAGIRFNWGAIQLTKFAGAVTAGGTVTPTWYDVLSTADTGTSGAKIPYLSGGNTWGATQTITTAGDGGLTITTTSGNAKIEIGRTDGVASTPFFDFHSGATATDYDFRVIASGGNGTAGNGTLTFEGKYLTSKAIFTITQPVSGVSTDGALVINNNLGTHALWFYPQMGAGNFNGIVQANDKGIIFTQGSAGTGALSIAPWVGATVGMRMDTVGTTFSGALSLPDGTSTGQHLVIKGGASEGGQITLGYGGNTAPTAGGASTWNIDVTSSTLRVFRYNSAGTASVPMTIAEDGTLSYGGNISAAANLTFTKAWEATNPSLYFNGSTGNWMLFNATGVAAPTNTTRSAGTKIVLYPSLTATNVDYALGIESSNFWFSSGGHFKWYGGNASLAMTLTNAGYLWAANGIESASHILIANPTPVLYMHETDAVLPAGRWRWLISSDTLYLQRNTAAAGDWTTATNHFYVNSGTIFLGTAVDIAPAAWHSSGGLGRMYFAGSSGPSYWRGSEHHWRNAADTTIASLTSAGAFSAISTVQGTQLISTVATGTAPLTVASTTKVTNLNADLIDGIDIEGISRIGYVVQKAGIHDNVTLRAGFYTISDGLPNATNTAVEGNWWHVINMRHGDNNGYAAQMAIGYFGSNDLKFRAANGTAWDVWRKVWHDGNDGAGSGLDADTLDGVNGADFAKVADLGNGTSNATLISAIDTAIAGPTLTLSKQRGLGNAASDRLGQIIFSGRNSSVAGKNFAAIVANVVDPGAGTEDGQLVFQTIVAGTVADRFRVGHGFMANGLSDMGDGTVNAKGIYVNGSAVSAFSLDAKAVIIGQDAMYWSNPYTMGIGANALILANYLHFTPIYIGRSVTVTRIGLHVANTGVGSARIGLYNVGADGEPGTRITDSGTVSVSTSGLKEITISQALTPGWYFLAIVSDVQFSASGLSPYGAIFGFTQWGGRISHFRRAFTYAALPADETAQAMTGLESEAPWAWVRVV